ncbi:hypothetical protein IF1G_02574 [Cordyceps javanica]|uniref:Uncharacterized protein n=1 Tax=Cordyceps javanica TaxID=43265 RepID=A0A545V9U4_9HYPO|nr:hypothetical protein IF1G_02574 [Cordyceps javanica]
MVLLCSYFLLFIFYRVFDLASYLHVLGTALAVGVVELATATLSRRSMCHDLPYNVFHFSVKIWTLLMKRAWR